MQCERVAEEIFRVTSESAADKTYAVDLSVPNCTCTWWATQRNKLVSKARRDGTDERKVHFECKHIVEAKRHKGDPIMDKKAKTQATKDRIVSKYTKNKTRDELIKTFQEMKEM